MEFQTISNIPHYVFDNEKEFNSYCINNNINPIPEIVKDWRKAEERDWVWSDDGRIVQILKRGPMNHSSEGKGFYVRTVVGTFCTRYKAGMDTDFSQHGNRYTLSKTLKNPNGGVLSRTEVSTKEELWAAEIILMGKDPWVAYQSVYGTKSLEKCKVKAALLLRQKRIIRHMSKLAMDAASELGINHEWVLTNYKKLVEDGSSENVRLGALDRVADIIGTSGEIKQETRELAAFQGFGNEDIKFVEGAAENKQLAEAEILEEDSE